MRALVIPSLSGQLVNVLREHILQGDFVVGVAIRQDELAAQLGVSKIPLREALARLEEEGLLKLHRNRGYFVRPLSRDEAEEVYALRLKLEPDAAALAAANASPADRQVAVEALRALEEVAGDHSAEGGPLHRGFHLALIRPSRQPITIATLERLQSLSERYVRKHLEPTGRLERARSEHSALLRAWLAGDGPETASLLTEHLARTLNDLRIQLPVMI